MKIALVNTLYAPYQVGGAERAAQILAEGLARRGHSISVITLGEGPGYGVTQVNGVAVHRLPLRNWYWPYSGFAANAAERAVWHLADFHNAGMAAGVGRVLDNVQPALVHTHNLAGFSVGVWEQARRRGLPVLHTVHDYYLMCPPSTMCRKANTPGGIGIANCERICARCSPFAAYRRQASRAVGAVAGVSQYILERHIGAGFFRHAETAKVIFNSVQPAGDTQRERRDGALTFGFIGRICPEKGIRWLLDTFTRNADPRASLLIAGKGEPSMMASLAAEFPSPSVTFLGHMDAAAFYERVDVVVIPSLWNEPFGRTAIEARAHGLPVIATRRGGLPEIIEDGITGIIVDPDDPDSLGVAMKRLLADRELVQSLRRGGAADLGRFAEDSTVDAYEAAYAEASCARYAEAL